MYCSLSHNIQLLQMVHLIQDPKGETVMGPSTTVDTAMHIQTKPSSMTGPPSQQEEVAQLKQRILELERGLHGKGISCMQHSIIFQHNNMFCFRVKLLYSVNISNINNVVL